MTAYTSTQSGDWDDVATWGGGGYPSTSGDTATVSAGHDVSVPVGVSITCGTVATNAGTSGDYTRLIIDGTFDLAGAWTFGNFTELVINGGAELDLNGYTITPGGNNKYTWQGSAGSRWSVISTASAGSFASPGASPLTPLMEYGDISGLADSTLGRSHTSAITPTFRHVTFTGCAALSLDATGTSVNAGFICENCDFIDPSAANPVTASDHQPMVLQTNAPAAGVRRYFRECTWSQSGGNPGLIAPQSQGIVFEPSCVINNYVINPGVRAVTIGGFWAAASGSYASSNPENATLTGFYGFYTGGDHPFSPAGVNGWVISGENVFEGTPAVKEDGVGTNWFLFGTTSTSLRLQDAIFLGEGNPVCITGTYSGEMTLSNNTSFLDNYGILGSGTYFATLLLTEQSGLITGPSEIYNNVIVKPNTSTPNDSFIDLIAGTAGQLDYVNNNCGWALPGGPYNPPVFYTANAKAGGPADMGERDVTADPQFFDSTRKLATWDGANGGPGTADNAITEMLKRNASDWNGLYDPQKLIAWVREGFTPRQRRLVNRGRRGGYIGAVRPRPKPALRINPL